MLRTKMLTDVASPRCALGTAFCIAIMNIVAVSPMARPSTVIEVHNSRIGA